MISSIITRLLKGKKKVRVEKNVEACDDTDQLDYSDTSSNYVIM